MFWTRIGIVLTAFLFATDANAAIVKEIDLDLGFDGHSYFDSSVYDISLCGPADELDACATVLFDGTGVWLNEANDVWGLPRLLPFTPGEKVSFTARLILPEAGTTEVGSVDFCRLGSLDCSFAIKVEADDTGFQLSYGASGLFGGGLTPGSSVFFREDSLPLGTGPYAGVTDSGDLALWRLWQGNFTVLEPVPPVTPVPLPASALLLPLGLIALCGRRRKGGREFRRMC